MSKRVSRLGILLICGLALAARAYWISQKGIRLSVKQFVTKVDDFQTGSISMCRFDGIREDRAYISSWEMYRIPRSIQYWTPVDEFDAEVLTRMRAEKPPWVCF